MLVTDDSMELLTNKNYSCVIKLQNKQQSIPHVFEHTVPVWQRHYQMHYVQKDN